MKKHVESSLPANHQCPGVVMWFLANPIAANLLMLFILFIGVVTAMDLRKEAFPAIAPNAVNISIPFPSGSAKAAEEGIAIKIESAIGGLQGVKRITTTSSAYDVSIEVIKNSKYDLDKLYVDIKNSVDAISSLPLQAEKPQITKAVWSEHAIWIQVFGEAEYETLQLLADELNKKLLSTHGINKVTTFGRRTPEISIEVNEKQLQSYNISLSFVAEKISSSSLLGGGGELKSANGTITVKAGEQAKRQRDFEKIVLLAFDNGTQLTLGEVASVRDGYVEEPVLSRYNGAPSIAIQVEMFGDSDVITSADKAKEVVELFKNRLPNNIKIAAWYDQSLYIIERLYLMFENSIQGILLVFLLLAIFLNLRVAIWVAAGLPVAFAGALWAMGDGIAALTINELTTFGFIITLGIVVDDAVIIGESIHTAREEEPNINGTIKGLNRVLVPATFGVLTTIVAFYCLTLVEGELGQLFAQFAIVGIFCLIFSLIESKLILPAHLNAHKESKKPRTKLALLWKYVQDGASTTLKKFTFVVYQPVLKKVLRYRYAALFIMLALFIFIAGLINNGVIRVVFFPKILSNVVSVNIYMEEGVGFGLTQREALRIEEAALILNKKLKNEHNISFDTIKDIQLRSIDASEINIIAELVSKDLRPTSISVITSQWKNIVGNVEGAASVDFSADWSGGVDDIRIEIASGDLNTLGILNEEISGALASFNSVTNIKNTFKSSQPQVKFELNALGYAVGLTMSDLSSQIHYAFQGFEVQRFQRGTDEIRVQVKYPKSNRSHFDDLENARIRTSSGKVYPLLAVTSMEVTDVESEIMRVNRNNVTVLTADVNKAISSPRKILDSLDKTIFKGLRGAYPEATISLGGEAAEQKESLKSLILASLLALFGIFTLLAVSLRSYTQPLIVMFAIPFGVIGALVGHLICNIPVSILSIFGILALSGVVVNDSLLLISRFNELRNEGIEYVDAICQSGTSRMRAVLLTSSTTFAGLAPLMTETSEQAQYLIPAAVSLGYGILFSTIITLIFIPLTLLIKRDIYHFFHNDKAILNTQ